MTPNQKDNPQGNIKLGVMLAGNESPPGGRGNPQASLGGGVGDHNPGGGGAASREQRVQTLAWVWESSDNRGKKTLIGEVLNPR